MTAELAAESEATSLCESLAISAASEPDLVSRISAYPGVAEPVQRGAEKLARQFWDAELNQRVDRVVAPLAAKFLLKLDVLESL
jgi:hypothetical protein